MRIICEDNYTIFKLKGEIDHHYSRQAREVIDNALQQNCTPRVILDFKEVSFMDSSGIGLVMGRYKLVQEMGSKLELHNLSRYLLKVMRISGLEKLEIKMTEGSAL